MAVQPPDNYENKDKPIVSTALNIGVIIGTILFPLVGLLMGFAYYRKDHSDASRKNLDDLRRNYDRIEYFLLNINATLWHRSASIISDRQNIGLSFVELKRSIPEVISSFADSTPSQPLILTHLPVSKSL